MPSAVFFASVSLLDPGALSPLLHHVLPDGFRHWCTFHIYGGACPLEFGPVGALGESRWLHLYRLTPDLVGLSHFCRVPLLLRSVFYVLLCDIPPVFMAIIWSVSLTPACPLHVTPIRGCTLDTCVACEWLDLLSSSSLFQDSVICADLWSRQSGPDDYCNRHSVALALSPSFTVVLNPCYCSMLGGLHGAWRLGCLHVPSSHFQDSVSCLTYSHDSQLLRLPAIDIVWRWPCLPRFRLLQTPCYSGTLGGLHVLVGSLTSPPRVVCLSLPTLGDCCA